jgi:two-component system OmpR family sensor kinase
MHSVLRQLHQSSKPILYYPTFGKIQTAIYDLDRGYIFGSFEKPPVLEKSTVPDLLVHIEKIEPYYLGAAYILTAKKTDWYPVERLQWHILLFMLGAGIFFSILGYFLGKLFVAPMRQSIEQMNHFIQDTTHELNTPISTILTNIELLETFGKCEEGTEELKRIEIASRTLSRIYDDLTYLNLNHHYHRNVVTLDMSTLVEERLIYFQGMAEAKGLQVQEEITPRVMLTIDRNDAIRLVDNLLSNAIKYNKPNGILSVVLDKKMLEITDTGIGIQKKDLATILQRFKRANKSEGGFGIGLDIVNQVVRNYGFTLKIESRVNKGTTVRVLWA